MKVCSHHFFNVPFLMVSVPQTSNEIDVRRRLSSGEEIPYSIGTEDNELGEGLCSFRDFLQSSIDMIYVKCNTNLPLI